MSESVRTSWLYRRVSVEEAERIHTDPSTHGGRALGPAHDAWEKMKASMKGGDELWIYDSRAHISPGACANYGLCVVRGGKAVVQLLLRIG